MKNHIHWAKQILEKQGYCLISSVPEKIQDMPWSEVYRFSTLQGNIYLKKTPSVMGVKYSIETNALGDKQIISKKIKIF